MQYPWGAVDIRRSAPPICHNGSVPRFLTLADVAEVLNISPAQAYALVRGGELRAIKVGGRGQWRVEESELETYITAMYKATETFVRDHPFGREDSLANDA